MEIINSELGVHLIQAKKFIDSRGNFVKTFNKELFEKLNLRTDFEESFYSTSNKNVIRGMHFQIPPFHHVKLVYVVKGSILDLALDLRKESPTFGKSVGYELNAENGQMLYIPEGFAHGFLSNEDDSIVVYLTTKGYSPEHDKGIHFESFGFDWTVKNTIVSERDSSFPNLADFDSPF